MTEIEDKAEAKDKRPMIIIGTSGSTDYLKDTTGDRRFWPVTVTVDPAPAPLSAEEQAVVQRLVEMTGGTWLDAAARDESCDGLHDEGAPPQYLCSRCFPDLREDLAESQEGEYDDARRDEHEEME